MKLKDKMSYEWMNEQMNEWMHAWMNEWMNKSVNDLMYKWIYGGQLSGWMVVCELKMTV